MDLEIRFFLRVPLVHWNSLSIVFRYTRSRPYMLNVSPSLAYSVRGQNADMRTSCNVISSYQDLLAVFSCTVWHRSYSSTSCQSTTKCCHRWSKLMLLLRVKYYGYISNKHCRWEETFFIQKLPTRWEFASGNFTAQLHVVWPFDPKVFECK